MTCRTPVAAPLPLGENGNDVIEAGDGDDIVQGGAVDGGDGDDDISPSFDGSDCIGGPGTDAGMNLHLCETISSIP